MNLAIFDLDNTLLNGDSDYLWGRFLIENGIVDAEFYERENKRFYAEYCAGTLNIFDFLAFALRPLQENELPVLLAWRERYIQEKILPIILPAARGLIETHRERGHTTMIITATNLFITEPIAAEFGVDYILATEPEFLDGRYTGQVKGQPCFQEGKVLRLQEWLQRHKRELSETWFYSDSHNDIPLLALVNHPNAVDPDPKLAAYAQEHAWPIISLRSQVEDIKSK